MKTNKYTSPEIQNEILKLVALQVLKEVAANLHSTTFYAIMVDETTDVSNDKQVVLCLCWVDNNFDAHEEFIGLYKVDSICSDSLVALIKDALLRMNRTLSKVRGQCYDGAANMAGSSLGLQRKSGLRNQEQYLPTAMVMRSVLLVKMLLINHLVLLYVHKNLTDNLNLTIVLLMILFLILSICRLTLFGRFQRGDLCHK